MKRLLVMAITLTLMLSACGPASDQEKDPLAGWLAAAKLDAEETPEELYAAALNEGILTVYSTSTRMMDVAKAFEKEYPGLVARVEHLRENDMITRLTGNYEAGNFACDLICTADGQGIIQNELMRKNIIVKYVPHDMRDKLLPGNNEDFLMFVGEAAVFSYNDAYYEEPPISNWWELTEEKWRGLVYMPNPMRSTTTLAFLNMTIENSGVMAKAYEDLYGQPLQLPDGESAGREFVRRLVANDVHIVNSSDETAAEIGYPGSPRPSVGIAISSKTRLRALGYTLTNHYGMEPFCGVYTPVSVMMAGGAKNVSAAKLFIRFLMGEADGQGEGYKPYLQSGAWSVRNDVRDDTGVRSEELNLLQLDKAYLYKNYDAFLAFWKELIEKRS